MKQRGRWTGRREGQRKQEAAGAGKLRSVGGTREDVDMAACGVGNTGVWVLVGAIRHELATVVVYNACEGTVEGCWLEGAARRSVCVGGGVGWGGVWGGPLRK